MSNQRIRLQERVPVILDEAAVLPFLAPSGLEAGRSRRRRRSSRHRHRHRQGKSRAVWLTVLVVLMAAGTAVWVQGSARASVIQQELAWQLGSGFFTDFDLAPYLSPDGWEPAATAWSVAGSTAAPARRAEPAVQPLAAERSAEALPGAPADVQTGAAPAPRLAATFGGANAGAIVARHEQRFTALEQVAMHKLDTLYETGRQEYEHERRIGVLDQVVLVLKYLEAGRVLERNMDVVFQAMVTDLRDDLSANRLPLDAAGLVESEYVSRKERLRGHYIGRIRQRTR
jgi:hypothetical protein